MLHTFIIRDILSLARSRTKKYFRTILLLGFLTFLPSPIASLFSGGLELAGISTTDLETETISYTSPSWEVIDTIVTIIGTLLYYRLLIGLTKCTIMIVQDIKPIVKDLALPPNYLVRWIFAQVVVYAVTLVGFVLLIIPGIIVAIRLSLFQYFIAEGYGIIDSIKASRHATEGNVRKFLWFGLTALGINILGFLALIFGLLRAIPLVAIAYAAVYLELKKNLPPEIQPQPIPTSKITSSLEAQMINA